MLRNRVFPPPLCEMKRSVTNRDKPRRGGDESANKRASKYSSGKPGRRESGKRSRRLESRGKGAESYNVFAVCLSKQASKRRKNTPGNNAKQAETVRRNSERQN